MLLGRNLGRKRLIWMLCCNKRGKSTSPHACCIDSTVFTDVRYSHSERMRGLIQANIPPSFHAVELIVLFGVPKRTWSFGELQDSLFFLLECFICCSRAESMALRRPLCFCFVGEQFCLHSLKLLRWRDVKSSEAASWIQLKPTLLPSSLCIWIVECLVITYRERCVSLSLSGRVCVCCAAFHSKSNAGYSYLISQTLDHKGVLTFAWWRIRKQYRNAAVSFADVNV